MSKKSRSRTSIGIHSCTEAVLKNSESIRSILIKKQRSHRLDQLLSLITGRNLKFREVEESVIDHIAPHNQGIAIEIEGYPQIDWSEVLEKEQSFLIGLDGIEDPHNMGAIIRTAWLLGADGLIVSEHRSIGLSPAVHKVACGGVEHLPIERVSKFSDITGKLKKHGFWIYGMSAEAKLSVFDYKPGEKTLLIAGAEDKGIRSTTASQCDDLIGIPQVIEGPSYNASVAMAISMAETQRQRGVFV